MSYDIEAIQKFGKEQVEASAAALSELTKGLQAIATEASDYSKKAIESGHSYVEKLFGVKKFDEAIKLQSDFARESYEGFVSQANKFGELYANVARDAFKPLEGVFQKATAAIKSTTPTTPPAN